MSASILFLITPAPRLQCGAFLGGIHPATSLTDAIILHPAKKFLQDLGNGFR